MKDPARQIQKPALIYPINEYTAVDILPWMKSKRQISFCRKIKLAILASPGTYASRQFNFLSESVPDDP